MSDFKIIKSLSGMLQILNENNKSPFKTELEIGEEGFTAFTNHYLPKDIEAFDRSIAERKIVPYLMMYHNERRSPETILFDLYKGFLQSDVLVHMAQSEEKEREFAVLVCTYTNEIAKVALESALEFLLKQGAYVDLNIQAVFITDHEPEFIGMLLMYTPDILPVFLVDSKTQLWYNRFESSIMIELVNASRKRKTLRMRYQDRGKIINVHRD